MPSLNSSEKARFEKFLASLPADRKKALYERFRKMDAEERNVAIRKILAKSSAPQGKEGPKAGQQKPSPAKRPQVDQARKDQHKTVAPKTVKQAKQPEKTPAKPEKQVKRPNFNRIVNVLTVMVVLGCLFTLALAYYTNRAEINSLFVKPFATETSESSSEPSGNETDPSGKATDGSSSENTSETTAEPDPTATPTPMPIKSDAPDLEGLTVVIDPMHQAETSTETEELLPDKTAFKAAATEGGKGVKTGVSESELVLEYALAAKEYLEKCGAKVVLTRSVNDIDLSNQDRARIATSSDCDIFIRLEARSVEDPAITGVRVMIPEYGKNKTKDIKTGKTLSKMIAEAENMEDGGALSTIAYTGLNYATSVRAFQLNLGFLSNENDETILADSGNIYKVAASLAEFCSTIKK